ALHFSQTFEKGKRIPRSAKPLPIFSTIDIQEDADVIHSHPLDSFGVRAKDGPATDIAGEIHQLRKNRPVEKNRVAPKAPIKRNQNLCLVLLAMRDHLVERGGLDEGLVGQNNEGGFRGRTHCRKALAQRCPHTLLKIEIDDYLHSIGWQLPLNFIRGS